MSKSRRQRDRRRLRIVETIESDRLNGGGGSVSGKNKSTSVESYESHNKQWWENWKKGDNYKSKSSCKHWRQSVELLEGVTISGSGWSDRPSKWQSDYDSEEGALKPGLGFYFYDSWGDDYVLTSPGVVGPPKNELSHPWVGDVVIVPWPDHGVPRWQAGFVVWADWVLKQAKKGVTVDLGCMGGHGRTGTGMAVFLVLQGMTPGRAIEKVRVDYCHHAIEGMKQVEYVKTVYVARWGELDPKDKEETEVYKHEAKATNYVSSYPSSSSAMGTGKKKPGWEDKNPSEKCPHDVWIDYVCAKCENPKAEEGTGVTKPGVKPTSTKCKHGVWLDYICAECDPQKVDDKKKGMVDVPGKCNQCRHVDSHRRFEAVDDKTYEWCNYSKCKCKKFHPTPSKDGTKKALASTGSTSPDASSKETTDTGTTGDEEEESDLAVKFPPPWKSDDPGDCKCGHAWVGHKPYQVDLHGDGHAKTFWWCQGDPDTITFDCMCEEAPPLRNSIRKSKGRWEG